MAPLTTARVGVRGLQAGAAVAAMVFTSLGYVEMKNGQVSSGAAIFAMFANYSALLCGAYYVGALHMLQLSSTAPRVLFQRLVDGAILVAVALAGVLHATSTAVAECEAKNKFFELFHDWSMFRCGNQKAAIVLTFITAGLFLVSLVQSYMADSIAEEAPTQEEQPAREYATVMTPTTKGQTPVATPVGRPGLRAARIGSRAVQFGCAAFALVSMAAAYKHYFTGQYISPKTMFALLAAYTCTIYSLWHLVAVEKLQLSRRPAIKVERIVDGVLAFALLVAGVVVVTSSHVQNCDDANAKFLKSHSTELYRCGSMSASIVFLFISIAMYLATIVISYMTGGVTEDDRFSVITVDEHPDASVQA